MPAAVVNSSAQASGGPSSTLTLTQNAAAETGDLLVLWATARGQTAFGATTIDRPTGWTRLGTTQTHFITPTLVVGGALFYRLHDEAEPTVTVTFGGAYVHPFSAVQLLGCTVIRGQKSGIWSGTVAEAIVPNPTPAVAADPSPSVRSLILHHYVRGDAGNFGPETGWTNLAWDNSVFAPGIANGGSWIIADPGGYTMPATLNIQSSVAIVDAPVRLTRGLTLGAKWGGGSGVRLAR